MAGYKIRMAFRNLADTATLAATSSASTTLAVANLQRPVERWRTWRSTSLAAQDITATWASNQNANMLMLYRHNLTTAAVLRALAFSAAGSPSNTLLDSGNTTPFSTTGLDTDIDVYTERDFRMLRNSIYYFGTEQTTMQALITRLTDSANTDGYVEVNRLFIGKSRQMVYSPPRGGLDLQWIDGSVSGRADDGTQQTDKRWRARRLTLNLDFIAAADYPTLVAGARYLGKNDKECVIDVYPLDGSAKSLYHLGIFKLVESPTFTPGIAGLNKTTMVFEEP